MNREDSLREGSHYIFYIQCLNGDNQYAGIHTYDTAFSLVQEIIFAICLLWVVIDALCLVRVVIVALCLGGDSCTFVPAAVDGLL